jgi:hypothetical protein
MKALFVGAIAALVLTWVPTTMANSSEAQTLGELALLESQVANVRSETIGAKIVDNCWVRTKKITGENFWDIDLWWIKQRTAACGEKITQNTAWVIASGPWYTPKCKGRSWNVTEYGALAGWNWEDWNACRAEGGVGDNRIYRYARGRFRLCQGVCVQDWKPYAWNRTWANGDYDSGGKEQWQG